MAVARLVLGEKWGAITGLFWFVLIFSVTLGDALVHDGNIHGVDWALWVSTGVYYGAVILGLVLAARPHVSNWGLVIAVLLFPAPGFLWAHFSPWAGIVHSYMHIG